MTPKEIVADWLKSDWNIVAGGPPTGYYISDLLMIHPANLAVKILESLVIK